MAIMKALVGVLLSAACLIAFLAMTDEYERAVASEGKPGRVLEVREGAVRFELYSPGSPWDEDGDGWVGPYTDEDVPEAVSAQLAPGATVTIKEGQLAESLSGPTPLLLLGVICGLLFAVWAFVGPRLERRAIQRAQADPARLIELMARKSRNTKIVGAVLLGAMGGGLVAVGLLAEAKLWEQGFIIGLGALGLLFAGVTAAGAWSLRDPKSSPLVRTIMDAPERIVWVYGRVHEVNGVDNHFVVLVEEDGRRHEFALGQVEAEPLLSALSERLPRAAFGYTEEHRATFERAS